MVKDPHQIGHTRIPNGAMEALARIRIPGEARQVLDVIIRRTLGWHKEEAEIPLLQYCEATGLTKVHVCRGLARLREMRLVIQKGNAVLFQTDIEQWLALPKKVTAKSLPKKVINVTQKGNAFLLEDKERKKFPPYTPPQGEGAGVSLLQDRFNRFAAAYPKTRSLGRAWRVWFTIRPSEELLEEMLSTIEAAKKSAEWQREGGRYIPKPSTWLRSWGWKDRFESSPSPIHQTACAPKTTYVLHGGQWFEVVDGKAEPVAEDQVPEEIRAKAEGRSKPPETPGPGFVATLISSIGMTAQGGVHA